MTGDCYELTNKSEYWPQMLDDLEKPPEKLYVKGNPQVLHEASISIIGARRATLYGLIAVESAARIAAECGLAIVSGGAMGCDCAAGMSALTAGAHSIVVSGCGADLVYPSSSRKLFEKSVSTGGAIVSLVPWGVRPLRYNFPKRNVIIAALSKCLFIAEAGIKSGTFSTAETAMKLGREILAVPGSIYSPNSSGTNRLIADGASIIVDEEELEIAISSSYGKSRIRFEGEKRTQTALLSALIACPMRPQELAERLNRDVLTLLYELADLESHSLVQVLPDGRYSPTQRAYLSHN